MLPFWIWKKKPVNHDEMQPTFLVSVKEKDYLPSEGGIYVKMSIRNGVEEEGFSTRRTAIAFKTQSCALEDCRTSLKMKPYHLNFSAFTAEFLTALMLTTHYGTDQSVKYSASCFTKYRFSRFVKRGEQVIAFNLCIFAKPYWIILLLEALETNSKKNHQVWKCILGYIISITV